MKITKATAQGKRPYQEDRYAVIELSHGFLIGIFDGHGGKEVAEVSRKMLFTESDLMKGENPEQELKSIVAALVRESLLHSKSGSTCSLVYIPSIWTAAHIVVLGDSPVIVGNKEISVVAPSHNVDENLAEAQGVRDRGGVVVHGYAMTHRFADEGLAMSRSLGDIKLGAILSREPDYVSIPLVSDSWILVGTDGLYTRAWNRNLMQNETFGSNYLSLLINEGHDAVYLVQDALKRKSQDNVTAILVSAD